MLKGYFLRNYFFPTKESYMYFVNMDSSSLTGIIITLNTPIKARSSHFRKKIINYISWQCSKASNHTAKFQVA